MDAPPRAPIVRRPPAHREKPVLVSIPHFGTDPLPDITAAHYRSADYVDFPYGYTDPFAAQIYGGLHADGATVVATTLSRLFVDVNRARDDYEVVDGVVASGAQDAPGGHRFRR